MKSLYTIELGLDEKYTELVDRALHIAIIAISVMILKNTKEVVLFDTFIYVLVGEVFYTMVFKYLISIK